MENSSNIKKMTNNMSKDIDDLTVDKIFSIIKDENIKLFAQRIAVEMYASLKVIGKLESNFDFYVDSALDSIEYTEKDMEVVKQLAKLYLEKNYHISMIDENPLVCFFNN